MFYVWFDDLNLWRKRVFTRELSVAEGAAPGSPQAEPGV